MDFAERISQLSDHAQSVTKASVGTEEGCKMALVLPFIQALGYDYTNPREVIPEFTADYGVKKGEKVDYAIMHDGKPILLIECKCFGSHLDIARESQLGRYFTNTEARIAILTDGIEYRFYTDLEQTNKMDQKPFMVFNLSSIDESLIEELRKLSKDKFDLEATLSAASELKYVREIKKLLAKQMEDPDEEFVRFFARQVYSGAITQKVKNQFYNVVKKAFNDFLVETLKEDFESYMTVKRNVSKEAVESEAEKPSDEPQENNGIVTTEEEWNGYYIVKAILSNTVDPKRVTIRDTKSYCGILLDDNNRKPICRVRFDYATKRCLSLFHEENSENIVEIESVEDIYKYADELRKTVKSYE